MDWTPIVDACVSLAALTVTGCTPIVTSYVRTHFKNKAAADLAARAITLGAGIAHDSLTSAVARGAPDWVTAKATAIGEGWAAAQRIDPTVAVTEVVAALAPLLAVDPSVPAGNASTATATAPAGGSAAALAEPAPAT